MTNTRSFLKWAGGKYNCLKHILSHLPEGSRLIEPFSGSGVVFMNTTYSSYLLAESNADLINLYNILKAEGETFIEYCARYFQPKYNQKSQYYELRSKFNSLKPSKQRAAIFLYLNRHGYNGLCRYNSSGIFNVPFGLYAKPYFPHEEMQQFHQKSQNAEFVLNDFRKTFEKAMSGDVIYCDPPYMPLSKKTKMLPYNQRLFAEQDQIELAELAKATAARGIPVLISNHDIEFIRHHYRDAEINSFAVSRFINCQSDSRQPVRELIAVFK